MENSFFLSFVFENKEKTKQTKPGFLSILFFLVFYIISSALVLHVPLFATYFGSLFFFLPLIYFSASLDPSPFPFPCLKGFCHFYFYTYLTPFIFIFHYLCHFLSVLIMNGNSQKEIVSAKTMGLVRTAEGWRGWGAAGPELNYTFSWASLNPL